MAPKSRHKFVSAVRVNLRVPHLGVYGDAQARGQSTIQAKLPSSAALHESPPFIETQHFALSGTNLLNALLHAWLFSSVSELSGKQQLESSAVCGLFALRNVAQVRCDAEQVKSALDRECPSPASRSAPCCLTDAPH